MNQSTKRRSNLSGIGKKILQAVLRNGLTILLALILFGGNSAHQGIQSIHLLSRPVQSHSRQWLWIF